VTDREFDSRCGSKTAATDSLRTFRILTWRFTFKEQPIPVHKRIRIGPINLAFMYASAKESCKQFVSGKVIFNHFEETSGKTFPLTDGDYELKFGFGKPETGHFKVDCEAPCS
jgi:hypothetical protein